jgi:hypothetical protein
MNKSASGLFKYGSSSAEGRDEAFWHLAEQELLNEDKSSPQRTPDNL